MVVNKAEISKKYGQQEKFWDTQQNLSELTMINKTTISEIEMDVLLELFIFLNMYWMLSAYNLKSLKRNILNWDEIESMF